MTHPDLPQALLSEKATLGSILLNREAIIAVAPWLEPGMFYWERHGLIYAHMLDLYHQGTPPDTRLLAQSLQRSGKLDEVGGITYLSDLTDCAPTSYHIEHYARQVEQAARLRALIATGGRIAALGYTPSISAEEAEAQAQTLLTQTALGRLSALTPGEQAVTEAWTDLHSDAPAFVATGYDDLDALVSVCPGDLLVLGARPAVGKTSWALSLTRNLCRRAEVVPLVISLEMTRLEVTQRLVSMESRVETRILRMRAIPDEQTHLALGAGYTTVGGWQWAIADLTGPTLQTIRALTMRHMAEHPRALVIIDYLGLMNGEGRQENRTQEVTGLSKGLKGLAKDARAPVLALCQLNRAVEGRSNHRPVLADFRDSGSVEQDADVAMFLYREELYDKDTDQKGIAELIIAKNRHGPIGVVPLRFDAATTRFDSLANPFGGPPWQGQKG